MYRFKNEYEAFFYVNSNSNFKFNLYSAGVAMCVFVLGTCISWLTSNAIPEDMSVFKMLVYVYLK